MSNTVPEVGDVVCIDHIMEGDFYFGEITKLEDGLVYAVVNVDGEDEEVCGDAPTNRRNDVWVIDSF